jgi:Ca2+-binding RTX toxin-like protein
VLTTDAPSITEGDAGQKALTFTLTLNEAPTMEVVVNYQTLTSGSATAGNDFVVDAGSVTFAAGQRTATVSVNVLGDTAFEAGETVQVQFSGSRLVSSVTATGTIANDDIDPATTPRTFVLTAGVDAGSAFTGSSVADIFDASVNANGTQTLQSSDSLNGGAGTDALVATITGTGTYAPTLTAIENVSATFTAAGTLSLANATGLESLTNDSSTANHGVTFSNIGSTSVALAMENTGTDTTFAFTSAATAGTNSVSLSLDNVSRTGSDTDVTIAGVETINIVTSGTASDIDLIAAAATTITASGNAALTLDSLNADGATAVTRVDGSTMTAALTVTADGLGTAQTTVTVIGGSGNDVIDVDDVANAVSVVGGAGNDTITAANLAGDITTADVINGGDGTDTLRISAALTVGTATGITSIETVQADGALTQDMDAFSATTVTRVNMAAAADISFDDVSANVTTLGISAAAAAGSSLARKTDTVADSLTVNLGATAAGVTVVELTIDNEESVTINSAGGANAITDLHASDATSLTITGSQSLDLDDNDVDGATSLATINASAFTGAALGINSSQSTVNLTFTGGAAADSITSGSGNDTLSGDAGNDSLSGGAGNDSLTGGTGNDTLVGGANNDVLVGGDGNDRLEAGDGVDNLSGGAGNDTMVFAATELANSTTAGTADTVDGGEGTDTVAITTATDFTSAVVLTSVETIELTTANGLATFNAGGAASLQTFTIKDNALLDDASFAVTNLVSGVTARLEEDDGNLTALTLDTAAGASLTINTVANSDTVVTVTDAVSVTVRTTGTGTRNDINGLVLDDADTTSLTVTGGTTTNATLLTGAVTGTNALQSVTASTSTSGASVTIDSLADADALTSLNITADYGNVVFGGNIGDGGSAEGLATINISASNGATANLDGRTIVADTTDSATDNAMTITASAGTSSTVQLGTITNTFGAITANVSGAGTTSADALTADDVTLNIAAGGGTYDVVTATDDIVITAANTAALTFSSLDAGATSAGTINVTASGSAALEISDVVTSAGALTVNGASATGAIRLLSANDYTGAITFTTGSGADNLASGSGNDVVSTGAGHDTIDSGTGNDSINAGAGNDTVTFDHDGDLTADDTVDGGEGTDTLNVTTAQSISSTSAISNFEVIAITANNGVETINLRNNNAQTITVADGSDQIFTLANVASGAAVRIEDADTLALTVDTVDQGSITIDLRNATQAGTGIDVTVADATSVTVTAGSTTAIGIMDDLTLDDIDTTSLSFVGGTTASRTLAADEIGGTDGLTSYSVSTSTAGATVTVGAMADADSLTSLTINAAIASATIGSVGGTGTAERLSQVTVSATGGATATINGTVTADTTDSTSDLAMTLTASAGTGSTVALGTINNQFGTITGTLSGAGVVGATALTADDITLTWSADGSSTITTLTASDDFALTNSGTGAHAITTLAVSGDVSITHTGSGSLTIGTANNGYDSLTVDASTATGALIVTTNSNASAAVVTSLIGGEGNDSLTGAAGNDVLSGGIGNDTIIGGTGADSISVGDGTDLVVINAAINSSSDSARVAVSGNDNDTGQDTISGFTWGTDTIRVVATGVVGTFAHATDVAIGTATGSVNDGTVGSFTASTGLINIDKTNTHFADGGDIALTFSSPSTALTATRLQDALQYDLTLGALAGANVTTGALADTIRAGHISDSITAGGGNDSISVTNLATIVSIAGGDGTDTLTVSTADLSVASGTMNGIETVVLNGNGIDLTVNVTTLANLNTLVATVRGFADSGTAVEYLTATGAGSANTANVSAITFTNSAFDYTVGHTGDSVTGGSASDFFRVGGTIASVASVNGGTGTDTLVLSGVDITGITTLTSIEAIQLASGIDVTLTATQVAALNTAAISITGTSGGVVETLNTTLAAAGSLSVSGITFTDAAASITGSSGNDTITGGSGADIITGSGGADSITGGNGVDRFVFAAGDSSSTATDIITDYATTEQIDHSGLSITANSSAVSSASGKAGLAGSGAAATFNGADNTLALRITAIEAALADTTHTAGEAAHWQQGSDVYVFITDGVAGVGSDDVIVRLVGVDSTNLAFDVLTITNNNLTLA